MALANFRAPADSFDWRDVNGQDYTTPVKDQGQAGTCEAFGSVGVVESKFEIFYGNPGLNLNLSEQHLVSNLGPDELLTEGLMRITNTGVVSEAELPYTAPNPSPAWPLQPYWEDRLYRITAFQEVTCTTDNLRSSLQQYGPLAAGMDSKYNWYWAGTSLGGFAPGQDPNNSPMNGTHRVAVVGYRDDASVPGGGYWIIKNSWGTGWGDHGYGYIRYGVLEAYNSVRAVTGDPYYSWERNTFWNGGDSGWSEAESWDRGVPNNKSMVFVDGGTAQVCGEAGEVSDLNVGRYVSGGLIISSGGTLSSSLASIGHYSGVGGTVSVDGQGSMWTNSGQVTVGNSGTGILSVTNQAALSSKSVQVGSDSGGTGRVTVTSGGQVSGNLGVHSGGIATITGPGCVWTASGGVSVGYDGKGDLEISDGATMTSSSGTVQASDVPSTVTISGQGSSWTLKSKIVIGEGGPDNSSALLKVLNGGALSVTGGYARLGYLSWVSGTVVVDGAGSSFSTSKSVEVGYNGQGFLTIANCGTVSSSGGTLGYNKTGKGTVVVDGAGSSWRMPSAISVGRIGTGSLTISNGGVVSNGDGLIGEQADSSGEVTVRGAGSTWANSGCLYVGGRSSGTGGNGQLTLAEAGAVTVGQMLKLWDKGTVNLGDGTITVGGGPGEIVPGTLRVQGNGTLAGLGTIEGNVANGGIASPGSSCGTLTIDGDYVQDAGGGLVVELSSGACDLLAVTGTATLDGRLEVVPLDGYVPPPGWMSPYFLTAGSLSMGLGEGYFDSVTEGWCLNADGSELRLVFVPEPSTLALLILGAAFVFRRRN